MKGTLYTQNQKLSVESDVLTSHLIEEVEISQNFVFWPGCWSSNSLLHYIVTPKCASIELYINTLLNYEHAATFDLNLPHLKPISVTNARTRTSTYTIYVPNFTFTVHRTSTCMFIAHHDIDKLAAAVGGTGADGSALGSVGPIECMG